MITPDPLAVDVFYFIVLVGVLVFVHELGHFTCAKIFGVHVIRFSLGFGPRLLGFRAGETEYVIAAFPLGGYVKMLGEDPHDHVAAEEHPRSFAAQSTFRRVLIIVAGPAMNLIFPIALFFLVYLGDADMQPAVVGTVLPGHPAESKLLPGDRIVAVDGEEVTTFREVYRIVQAQTGRPIRLDLDREGVSVTETLVPVLSNRVGELEQVKAVGLIGIRPLHPTPVIGVVSPRSPAAAAGLRSFDVIVSVAGRPVRRWVDFQKEMDRQRGSLVPVTYLRPSLLQRAVGGLADIEVYDPHVALLSPEPGPGSTVLRAGIEPADLYVSRVKLDSPEFRAGLRPGDRLVTMNGRPLRTWSSFWQQIVALGDRPIEIVYRRDDRLHTARYRRRSDLLGAVNQHGEMRGEGMGNWVPLVAEHGVENPHPITYAFERAFESTREMAELTVLSVVRLLQGRLSVESIGGPLSVYDEAVAAGRKGTSDYLLLMAFISVNLGIINLFPIPLLDGGHLAFVAAESVSRRRLPARFREYASVVGLLILVLIMALAFKNDLYRDETAGGAWVEASDNLEQ